MNFNKLLCIIFITFSLIFFSNPAVYAAQKGVDFHTTSVSIEPNKEIINGYFFNYTPRSVTVSQLSLNVFITDLLKGTTVVSDHAIFTDLNINIDSQKRVNQVFVIKNENFHGYTGQYHWKISSNIWFVNK
jgi:hypothetical protein